MKEVGLLLLWGVGAQDVVSCGSRGVALDLSTATESFNDVAVANETIARSLNGTVELYDGERWSQLREETESFGAGLALSGDSLVVTAHSAAFIYKIHPARLVEKIDVEGPLTAAMSGSLLALGSPSTSTVTLYENGKLQLLEAPEVPFFGVDLVLGRRGLVVGSGSDAFVYERSTWVLSRTEPLQKRSLCDNLVDVAVRNNVLPEGTTLEDTIARTTELHRRLQTTDPSTPLPTPLPTPVPSHVPTVTTISKSRTSARTTTMTDADVSRTSNATSSKNKGRSSAIGTTNLIILAAVVVGIIIFCVLGYSFYCAGGNKNYDDDEPRMSQMEKVTEVEMPI